MRLLFSVLCFLFSGSVLAYAPVDLLPEGSRSSLVVKTLDNPVMSTNPDQLFPPASTLKLVTALAAKLELGDDFRFTTTLEQKGDDLVFRFSGDPTLKREDLDKLIASLARQGISSIKGTVWLDNSAFTGYERGVGWPWDILGVCYSAPSSAITLDNNCVQASIYTEQKGSTRVFVPEHQPIIVTTLVKSVSKEEQKESQCDLELLTYDNNKYQLSGCLVQRDKPLPLKFAVQETHAYTRSVIRSLFTKHSIAFNGQIKVGTASAEQTLAVHHSASLNDLLEEMLKKSTNLIADNLTKTLGSRFYSQPGSFNNGTEAIKQIIYSNTGVDLKSAQLADGSGLSRNNRLAAGDLSSILGFILNNDSELGLISLLPRAGEEGTLTYRRSMRKAPVKGNLQAKSGSVYGTYNMAGFVLNGDGRPKATFVQFISDYHPEKKESESDSLPSIFQFENLFYQDLIRLSPKSNSLQ